MTSIFSLEQQCLIALADRVWNRRVRAQAVNMKLREESITEDFLIELASTYPGNVTIVPFNPNVESKLGADWVWCFRRADKSAYFAMMVQAKSLDRREHSYPEISHKNRKTGEKQIDKLIEVSDRLGFPAVYAFYNSLTDTKRIPANCTSLAKLGPNPLPTTWGVAIAPARSVRSKLPNKRFSEHSKHSMPLHCLQCSKATGHRPPGGSPEAVASSLRKLFDDPGRDTLTPQEGQHPLISFAEQLAGMDIDRAEDMIEKVRDEYPGVDGVVIITDKDMDY